MQAIDDEDELKTGPVGVQRAAIKKVVKQIVDRLKTLRDQAGDKNAAENLVHQLKRGQKDERT